MAANDARGDGNFPFSTPQPLHTPVGNDVHRRMPATVFSDVTMDAVSLICPVHTTNAAETAHRTRRLWGLHQMRAFLL